MSAGREKTMTDAEIVDVIRQHPDRAVTATEVADRVDMTNTGVLKRLNQLAENDQLTRKKVGGRAVVWWVPGDHQADSFARDRPASESQ